MLDLNTFSSCYKGTGGFLQLLHESMKEGVRLIKPMSMFKAVFNLTFLGGRGVSL